jgi:hypothetical protein
MKNEYMVPAMVADMIRRLLDATLPRHERENVASRLEAIVSTCAEALRKYQADQKLFGGRR